MNGALGVKNGRLAVTQAKGPCGPPSSQQHVQILKGGLKRMLLPLGVRLLREAGVQTGDSFILLLDNDRTSVACVLAAMELRSYCILLGKGRMGLLEYVQRQTGIQTTVTADDVTQSVILRKSEKLPSWVHDDSIRGRGAVGLLTSGSVGCPKVVLCSWDRMLLQGIATHEQLFPASQSVRIVCATSISHAYSINAIFTLFTSVVDDQSELCFASDVSSLHQMLTKPAMFTLLYGTPATYTYLLEMPAQPLFVDIPYCAGTSLSLSLYYDIKTHSGLSLMQNYGTTETGDIAAWYLYGQNRIEEARYMTENKSSYVGCLWPGVSIDIDSKSGEVLVTTPWQSIGYVIDSMLQVRPPGIPHATADRGRLVQSNKGHIALWLDGRIRPSIEVGVNGTTKFLSPESIEQIFLTHPQISDALVLMTMTTSLHVRVVCAEDKRKSVPVEELQVWAASQIPLDLSLILIEVVEYLSCSPAGKLLYT